MPIFLRDSNIWTETRGDNKLLSVAGHRNMVQEIEGFLNNNPSYDEVVAKLKTYKGFFSFIYEDDDKVIAAVDHIRSYPVFYHKDNVSNSAYELKDRFLLEAIDEDSTIEFAMAGYVTGSNTLLKEVKVLQPGEVLFINKSNDVCKLRRYFRYMPREKNNDDTQNKIKDLNNILDKITKDIINRAGGRAIYVPLSAGLDSRIILCKLHEHGYKNIKTFTYGPKYNFEAKYAKRIAQKLGYEWQHIIPSKAWIKSCFNSDERKKFWEYACEFKSIPSMREYSALLYMHERGLIEEDAIFINGQSGDFISGGHISKDLICANAEKETLYNAIIDKHYDLWQSLKSEKNINIIKKRIESIVSELEENDIYSQYETWEYECRQVVLVINGQRIYEYLGYDWELPLWEKELVDYFADLSVEDKLEQRLYKEFLQQYNYMGLFPEKEPDIWRWPANMLWVLPVAKGIELVSGRQVKESFYAYMKYHGHYSDQYNFIDFGAHKKTYKYTRNIMSLYARNWIIENKDSFSSEIRKGVLFE